MWFLKKKEGDTRPVKHEQRVWIPSGLLYPLTITVDLLLILDLRLLDPVPVIDEFVLIALGFFLNRSALRRLGWWPSPPESKKQQHDEQ